MFRDDLKFTEAVSERDPRGPNTPEEIKLADALLAEAADEEARFGRLQEHISTINRECRALERSSLDKRYAAQKILVGRACIPV